VRRLLGSSLFGGRCGADAGDLTCLCGGGVVSSLSLWLYIFDRRSVGLMMTAAAREHGTLTVWAVRGRSCRPSFVLFFSFFLLKWKLFTRVL
jgi:hypothetical protein